MKVIKPILFWVVSLFTIITLTIGVFLLIAKIQEVLFLGNEYIIWVFKSPFSSSILVYEAYIIFLHFYTYNIIIKHDRESFTSAVSRLIIRYKWHVIAANVLLLYVILLNVAVIKDNSIINYSPLVPQGKTYSYNDIVSIDAGIYGKEDSIPYIRSKGQFFYILEFSDGKRIDLNGDLGGTYMEMDSYKVFRIIDDKLVSMGIEKTSSMDNFELFSEHLDPIYWNYVKDVLMNVR